MKKLVALLCVVALSSLSFAFAGQGSYAGGLEAPPVEGRSVHAGG